MSESVISQDGNLPEAVREARARTPARLFTGRAGGGYPTQLALQLRADHAAARDAVNDDIQPERDFAPDWWHHHKLFELNTQAQSRTEYLLRPDQGRRLSADSERRLMELGTTGADLQVVLGDGLSARAAIQHSPPLLDLLAEQTSAAHLSWGNPFLIHYCRVGIVNEIGRLLQSTVVILLIGERPGLAQANSLSAYLAYRPLPGNTDAQRNLVSNIHDQGLSVSEAAIRIMNLAKRMLQHKISGVQLKETSDIAHQTRIS